MLLIYGTIPMSELIDGCLQRVRLKGCTDEPLWRNLIEAMATVLIQTMAPVGRVSLNMGYEKLSDEVDLESIMTTFDSLPTVSSGATGKTEPVFPPVSRG